MEISPGKHSLLLELMGLFNKYFFTAVIISIVLYLLTVLTMKIIHKNYIQNPKDILDKLCRSIVEYNQVDCVRILEEHPQYINKHAENGYTPFLVACAAGNTQILKIMLRKGADVRVKSWKHESAFYMACFFYVKNPHLKDASCIRDLYYAGVDINEPNYKGLTPIQMAAMFGHTPLVKWLLHKNASTNVLPNPFLIAVTQGHQETASVLWKLGSNFSIDYK